MSHSAKIEAEFAEAHARIAELEAENRELRRLLEEEGRKGKRQASPFAKALKKDPKQPGQARVQVWEPLAEAPAA